MQEKELTLTENEVNTLLNYLAERPYREVANLITMLQVKWAKQNNPEN